MEGLVVTGCQEKHEWVKSRDLTTVLPMLVRATGFYGSHNCEANGPMTVYLDARDEAETDPYQPAVLRGTRIVLVAHRTSRMQCT